MKETVFGFFSSKMKANIRFQYGFTLIEMLVSLAVLGTIAVVFLSGLVTINKAASIHDRQTTAMNLAQNQVEYVKTAPYIYETLEYDPDALPDDRKYARYSASIYAEPLSSPDNGIQKITVVIEHSGNQLIQLEMYKTDR